MIVVRLAFQAKFGRAGELAAGMKQALPKVARSAGLQAVTCVSSPT